MLLQDRGLRRRGVDGERWRKDSHLNRLTLADPPSYKPRHSAFGVNINVMFLFSSKLCIFVSRTRHYFCSTAGSKAYLNNDGFDMFQAQLTSSLLSIPSLTEMISRHQIILFLADHLHSNRWPALLITRGLFSTPITISIKTTGKIGV